MTITPSYIPGQTQTDQQAAARAVTLGIGIAPRVVPPVYVPYVSNTPGVIAEYSGRVVFLFDNGSITSTDVTNLIAPLVTQQAADVAAAAADAARLTRVLNAVAVLNARSVTYASQVVNSGNAVAVLQAVVNDLSVLYSNLADLITNLYLP
jgi:hypothetical protein